MAPNHVGEGGESWAIGGGGRGRLKQGPGKRDG